MSRVRSKIAVPAVITSKSPLKVFIALLSVSLILQVGAQTGGSVV